MHAVCTRIDMSGAGGYMDDIMDSEDGSSSRILDFALRGYVDNHSLKDCGMRCSVWYLN
jgi:hypothetical protein